MSTYKQLQQGSQDALRVAVLDAAGRLLTAEGPRALTMRRIAAELGCSTTVLYTVFGGKEGIAEGLYREGFHRLSERLGAVADGGSIWDRLDGFRRAFRDHALANPDYYRMMFTSPVPGFAPSEPARQLARSTLAVVAEAARAGIEQGVLVAADPWVVAETLWAAAHGVVSLELAGWFQEPDQAAERFDQLTRAAASLFVAPAAGA